MWLRLPPIVAVENACAAAGTPPLPHPTPPLPSLPHALPVLDALALVSQEYGHIYMYRFRPTNYEMKAHSFHSYPARCPAGVPLVYAKCLWSRPF